MKFDFTKEEVRDLLISSLVLAFIFTLTNLTLATYLISFLIIVPVFVFHELAHKFVAQKRGYIAHYVLWPTGAIMSVLFSLLSFGRFIFAALGAVMIQDKYSSHIGYRYSMISREDMGIISVAGPLTNFAMAAIGYALAPISNLFSVFAELNIIIGLFNMIPFPPLDGQKIFAWSWKTWLVVSVIGGVLLFLPKLIGIAWTLVLTAILAVITFIVINFLAPPRGRVRDIEMIYQ